MNIIVCIKQVPDTEAIKFDSEKGILIREGVGAIINPPDLHAIEAALTLKDSLGARITAVTMGPPQAEQALRDAISLGVDDVVLLSDRAFAGADTLATTYVLAKAIKKIGSFDLVICGKQAVDGDTAQVGPGLAARLNVPSVTCVSEIGPNVSEGLLQLTRMTDNGRDLLELRLPALITVHPSLNDPRVPSLRGKMRAKKTTVPVWGLEDLGADPERTGLKGSPTRVKSTWIPSFEARREILSGSPEEQVGTLMERLKEAGVI